MWIRRGGILKNVSEAKFKQEYAQRGYEPVVNEEPVPIAVQAPAPANEPETAPEPAEMPEAAEPAVEPEDEPDAEEPENELFVCPECGKEYKTEDGMNKHMKAKHESGETSE